MFVCLFGMVVTETIWSTKPKIFTILSFTEKFAEFYCRDFILTAVEPLEGSKQRNVMI